MARSSSVIGLSRTLVEGLGAETGEGSPPPARPVFAENGTEASLEAFLADAKWEPGVAIVVLPTEEAIFRRLRFPFREPRRIRQVIKFELESELLEDVELFTIDQEIEPAGDAGADVQAYLVRSERIAAATKATRAAGLQPYRVTLSAHALLAAHPPEQPLAFQVYAGAEESFVSLVHKGRIEAVRSVSTGLPALVLELQKQGIASAREIRWVLQGESDSDRINRALVRSRVAGELAGLASELNLFLRAHDRGQPYGVEFYGLFGAFLRHGESGTVEALEAPPQSPGPGQERRFLGIVDEVRANPEVLLTRQGLNFHAAGYGLLGQLPELRKPLIAATALFALICVLAATQYVVRTVDLWRQRKAVEAQIQVIIQKNVASNPPIITGVPILKERVQKARDEAKGSARFGAYQYDALTLLSELSASFGGASGITVESITFGKDRLAVLGTTPSFQASEELKNRLAGVASFKGKEPKLTHQRAGQTITFRLSIE